MRPDDDALGAVMTRLFETIKARRSASPATSYTAALLDAGPARCAQKFGEEAVDAAIAAATGDKAALTGEAADALYHLLVMLAATDVTPGDVALALKRREGVSGHAEKAARE